MPFIEENIEYIILALFGLCILLLFLMLVILRYNIYLSRFFSNQKFRVNSKYEFEPTTLQKTFSLNIFNNNVNDSRIIAFGYIYKNHNIDYYKTYLKDHQLPMDAKVIIPSRDCILSKVDAVNLKTIITDMNEGKPDVKKIRSFVSDAQGLTYKSKAKAVAKQLASLIRKDLEIEKAKKKEMRLNMKKEKQELKRKARIDKRLKRREKIDKIKLRFKSFLPFSKKPKSQ